MANESTPNSAAANTPTAESNIPTSQVRPGGAPARVYMNEKIVPYLLEGMKNVTKEQCVYPLAVSETPIQS
jgi:COMPASS component SDC1